MIKLVEALNYRCMRFARRSLGRFHVLVGPNGSGKTTFLDIVGFLGDLVKGDLEQVIASRTQNFEDLLWLRRGDKFELAIELEIPKERKSLLAPRAQPFGTVRYEVAISREPDGVEIAAEKVILKPPERAVPCRQRELFPREPQPPSTIGSARSAQGVKTVVNKVKGSNDNFYDETGKGWDHAFKLGPRRSALGNLPEDESKFPVATWLKGVLVDGIQKLALNSLLMRKPCPPIQPKTFRPDGANLPLAVARLRAEHSDRFRAWIAHLQTSLPDLHDIEVIERPEDKHRYLVVEYANGLKAPSWITSDGTLRLLALTLPAYLPGWEGVYLIEEPENGIHPRAIETLFQSLSSVYDAQVLLATHSPVILNLAEPEDVLCFARTDSGATDIVLGSEHPALRGWRKETTLGTLLAGGVLG